MPGFHHRRGSDSTRLHTVLSVTPGGGLRSASRPLASPRHPRRHAPVNRILPLGLMLSRVKMNVMLPSLSPFGTLYAHLLTPLTAFHPPDTVPLMGRGAQPGHWKGAFHAMAIVPCTTCHYLRQDVETPHPLPNHGLTTPSEAPISHLPPRKGPDGHTISSYGSPASPQCPGHPHNIDTTSCPCYGWNRLFTW